MKKRLIGRAVALALALIMLSGVVALAESGFPFVAYTRALTPLRASASTRAATLKQVPAAEGVAVMGEDASFYIVEHDGNIGYMEKSALVLSQSDVAIATPVPVKQEIADRYPQIRMGDSGDQVKPLQEALKELGFYKGAVDGKFGEGSLKAVEAFQEKNKLPVNGIADAHSQELLFEGKPRNARNRIQTVSVLPASGQVSISVGRKGPQVSAIQERLKALGFYKGRVDGIYGKGTANAVREFQKKNKLKIDGIAGAKTVALILEGGLAINATATPKPATTPAPTGETSVTDQVFVAEKAKATYPYTTTTNAAVNLRKSASLRAMRLLTIPVSASIEVLSTSGNFLKVNYKKYTGYVAMEYVNVPEQYLPGRVLRDDTKAKSDYEAVAQGASGASVKALQEALAELGFYKGKVDGNYQSQTLLSVKAFQKMNGLKETGYLTPEEQKLIFQGAVKNSQRRTARVKTLPNIANYPMAEGNRGDAVLALNQKLALLGFLDKTPDNLYTKDTTAAVKAFQKAHSIRQSGKMDDFTYQAMNLLLTTPAPVLGGDTPAQPVEQPVVVPPVTPQQALLKIGSLGDSVKAMQTRLIALNYLTGTADGNFGTQTAKAVTAFQKANGLKADGVAGAETLSRLYGFDAKSNAPATPTTQDKPLDQVTKPLALGDRGLAVLNMQQRLITLNYLTGGADGIFGPKTYTALSSFQQSNSLSVSGSADQQTLTRLNSTGAVAAGGFANPLPQAPVTPATPTAFSAPKASEVRMGNWEDEVKARARVLPNIVIYDFLSGNHYNVHLFSLGKHADGEPVTKLDTDTMYKALGYENWEPRPVWVIFSDGRVYLGSTHSHGHDVDHNADNGLTGHICVHFPRDMKLAEAVGPYAVAHQNAIITGWDLTRAMAK